MRTSPEGADTRTPHAGPVRRGHSPEKLNEIVLNCLEDAKAEDIASIDLAGKTSIGDYMVIASGRSNRHVGAIADQLLKKLKDIGYGKARVEGLPHCDWVLIDAGDIIIHIFRPEVREFYNLEKMWSAARPTELDVIHN